MRPTCQGDDCTRPMYILGTGLCSGHLQRWRRRNPTAAQASIDTATSLMPIHLTWPAQTLVEQGHDDGLDQLREWQAGRCAICGSAELLVTDHDHASLLVRGLLCISCNVAEGKTWDARWLARYRALPPTTVTGLRVVYVSSWVPLAPLEHASTADVVAVMRGRDWA